MGLQLFAMALRLFLFCTTVLSLIKIRTQQNNVNKDTFQLIES